MSKLIYWFGGLVALTFLVWVSLTSPTLYECLSNQPQNETGNSLQEYVASFYVFLLGSRTCVGSYIHENADAVIALFTIILALATILLWVVTQGILADSRRTTEKQLRAYLTIDGHKFDIEMSRAEITIRNCGQTPASNVRGHLNFEKTKFGEPLPLDFPFPDYDSLTIGQVGTGVLRLGPTQQFPWTFSLIKQDFDRAKKGEINLHIYGWIKYIDVFDVSHRLNFYYIATCIDAGKGSILAANYHNDEVDD